jgi:Ca-activated chloride channel family protein
LTKANFRVLDDGVEQPIAFFAPVEAPAQVLVLLETSPAVYLIQSQHLAAAYALLNGLAADDEVALVSYSQAPQALLAFTPDKQEFLAAMGQVQYTLGTSDLNFFDSVSTVLDWLTPVTGKKAVVMLTTGLDSSPPSRWDALVQKLRGRDVALFSVALGGALRQPAPKKKKQPKAASNADESAGDPNPLSFGKADADLMALAKISGGRAYFPAAPGDFVSIYREIAAALRHQYVLGIDPQHDGKLHSLTVQIVESGERSHATAAKQPEYSILAREGYFAPGR